MIFIDLLFDELGDNTALADSCILLWVPVSPTTMNLSKYSKSLIPEIIINLHLSSTQSKCHLLQAISSQTLSPFPFPNNHQRMILSTSYSVKLPKKYRNILYLHAACNDTFVFLGMLVDRKDGLVHVDSQGKILFQHFFGQAMDTIGMLSDREVILIQTKKNRISVLNLTTHSFTYFPFQFMNEEADQSDIRTFSETKYLCLQQRGRYNDARYKLTYFTYPLQLNQKKAAKSLFCYQSKDNQWTYQHMTKKANNYSMMMWYKPRHDDAFEFKTYDIQQGKGQFRHYRFPHSIAATSHQYKVEALIYNAWEIKPSNFIFLCWAADAGKKEGTCINSNYVIDLENKGEIRQTRFSFGPYQDLLIDCINLGTYSMFRTFKVQQNKVLSTPTYYIDNQSETLMAEEVWKCSHLYKYEFQGYATGLLCQGLYENLDVDKFQVNLKRVISQKDVYTFFLKEWMGEQIDTDLINDVLFVLG